MERRAEHGFDPDAVSAAVAAGHRPPGQGDAGRDRRDLRGAMGTPDQVRDYLRRYEEYGVDQVILSSSAGRNRHEHVWRASSCSHARCCPSSKTARSSEQREKAERLAPVIEAAMARKPATRPPAARPRLRDPRATRASTPTATSR